MNIKSINDNKKNIRNNLKNLMIKQINKFNERTDIIDNLKPTIMNKSNFIISIQDVDNIKNYIEQTKLYKKQKICYNDYRRE